MPPSGASKVAIKEPGPAVVYETIVIDKHGSFY
jgi:hypothetical protein